MRLFAAFFITTSMLFVVAGSSSKALATTGPGCLRVVNVESGDVLNIRRSPSASARVTGAIDPDNQGIISLRGVCKPLNRPWASRWCPVAYYTGQPNDPVRGWVKARFVRDSECP